MSRSRTKRAPFPSRQQILQYIQDSQRRVGKRDIARAFKLDSEQKRMLKTVLREMQDEGVLERGRGRRVHAAGMLPKVTVVEITGTDMDGEVLARPVTWEGDREPPLIYMAPSGRQPAPGRGDRLLAKLKLADDGTYEGHAIRRIAEAPTQILGVYRLIGGQGRLLPTDRRSKGEFLIEQRDARGAKPGDLVRAEPL
ncbi:MAG TPA: ribonuclease R, partial [Rhodospirillales bacterium]